MFPRLRKVHPQLAGSQRQLSLAFYPRNLTDVVVLINQAIVENIEDVTPGSSPRCNQRPLLLGVITCHPRHDAMGAVADIGHGKAIDMGRTGQEPELTPFTTGRGAPLHEEFDHPVIQGEDIVATRFGPPTLNEFTQLFRMGFRQVVTL